MRPRILLAISGCGHADHPFSSSPFRTFIEALGYAMERCVVSPARAFWRGVSDARLVMAGEHLRPIQAGPCRILPGGGHRHRRLRYSRVSGDELIGYSAVSLSCGTARQT